MSMIADHTHHIKLRSAQMEMPTREAPRGNEDFDDKLKAAQEEMERIQSRQEELARKKKELEDLHSRKRMFLTQQAELCEKLTSAVTLIDRELEVVYQEKEDLEQCRSCFGAHLEKIQKINPESWTSDALADRLQRADVLIDIAVDEYDQAAAHFEHSRCGSIFGRVTGRKRAKNSAAGSGEFLSQLRNGLAFNLPVYLLGTVALVVYLLR
jgi:uncharacterized membrane protein YccC